MLVPIHVSARHLHITEADMETLFGPGYRLTKLRDLGQPGEFAANETVAVMGPKRRTIDNVRILGPHRNITQVELSYTDGIYLGIDLPHRLSGDIQGSAAILLVGPEGILDLKQGAIRAQRHIHIHPEQAEKWQLRQGQKVSVQTRGPMKVTFNNVVIRTGENLNLGMHIDTDEANAAGIQSGEIGVIIP
jgi:propanediol utilization protein